MQYAFVCIIVDINYHPNIAKINVQGCIEQSGQPGRPLFARKQRNLHCDVHVASVPRDGVWRVRTSVYFYVYEVAM